MQVPPPCDLTLGMVCTDKAEPGRTTWQMKADERFANPSGIVQGGFLAAMLDSAMGASSVTWARERKVLSLTADLTISFLKPARVGSLLTCTAWVVSGGSKVAFLEAEIVDDDARRIAKGSSTYILTARDA